MPGAKYPEFTSGSRKKLQELLNKPMTESRSQSFGAVTVQMDFRLELTVFVKWDDDDSIMYIRVTNHLTNGFKLETKMTDAYDIRKTIEYVLDMTKETDRPLVATNLNWG